MKVKRHFTFGTVIVALVLSALGVWAGLNAPTLRGFANAALPVVCVMMALMFRLAGTNEMKYGEHGAWLAAVVTLALAWIEILWGAHLLTLLANWVKSA